MPRILIVEDNAKVAGILSEYLQKKGLDADVAADGEAALRSFAAQTYDLLLVDVRLPRMSGDDLCRQVRADSGGSSLPIIMMSGFIKDPGEIEQLKQELSLSAFITKPFTSDALLAQITAALRAQGTSAAAAPPARPVQSVTGDLSRTPVEKVLVYLYRNRAHGSLMLQRDQTKRRFVFLGGSPVDLDVTPTSDDLGHYLAHKNLITAAELEAYEGQRDRAQGDARELFIKMGCLSPERFQEEHRNFVYDRLIECFGWDTGTALFTGAPAFLAGDLPSRAFVPALFYRGFSDHLPASRIGAFLDEKGKLYPSKTAEFYDLQNHLADELPGTQLYDLIDGVSTCSGIVTALDQDAATTILFTLDFLQLLEYSPTPKRSAAAPSFPVRARIQRQAEQPEEVESFEDLGEELSGLAEEIDGLAAAASAAAADMGGEAQTALEDDLKDRWEELKDKNYYEIFGMTQNTFSFEKLKSSYFDLTRTYGPEKFFASSGEVMELAEEFLSLVSNAYTTLSNVVSKENYDALLVSKAPTGANEKKFYEQVQFQSGKVMLDQGQYDSAEKTFTTCLTMNPDKPEYQVYLSVAIYHNPANRGNAAAIKRSKDLVNKSLLWEKTAIAYALKGTMLLDEGLTNLAEAEFNKALRLNPKNKTALKRLEEMRQKKEEEEKKGFFQKMFK
jgi:DNA-binding response OmpR family regulator/curved DNA-binding protein CbpA